MGCEEGRLPWGSEPSPGLTHCFSLTAQLGPVAMSPILPLLSDPSGAPSSGEGLNGLALLLGGDTLTLHSLQPTSST